MKSLRLCSLLCCVYLWSCNAGGYQNHTVVTISPRPASVYVGQSQDFSASIQHDHHSGLGVTWSLNGAGSLSDNTALSVTYVPPATVPPNATVTITATAQVDTSATDSVTFTLAVNPISGNNYFGAQSPGDVWLFTLDDVGHQFSALNQTSNLSYTGTTTPLTNGFLKTSITNSSDPNIPVGTTGYAVEVPGAAAILVLDGGTDRPVALVAQSPCPTLSGPTPVQLVNLGKSTYDSTQSESYALVNAAQSGSAFNFSINSYLLDGTVRTSQSGPLPSGTCSNGVILIPNVPTGNGTTTTVTVAAATNGLYIVDLGPGRGAAVGSQNFVVDSATLSSAMTGNYIGTIFRRNSTPITTFVGFGPGSGTSISGGSFANLDTDAFAMHANNVTLNFTTMNANGFLEGDVNDTGSGIDHSPFVAMVTQNGGKFFIFGITTDTSTTTPYVILLAQQ